MAYNKENHKKSSEPSGKEKLDAQKAALVDKILEIIASDKMPKWEKGWSGPETMLQRNPYTKTIYKGINQLYLSFAAMDKGYEDPRWITYNNMITENTKRQEENSKSNKKGENKPLLYLKENDSHGTPISFWQVTWMKKDKDGKTKWKTEKKAKKEHMTEKQLKEEGWHKLLIEHPHTVFNAQQIDNFPPLPKKRVEHLDPEEERQAVLAVIRELEECSICPVHEKQTDQAFYVPFEDYIQIPEADLYPKIYDMVSTLAHEMGHASGHESRLNRQIANFFGTEAYAKEELVAEMSAVFTQASLQMPVFGTTLENSAAYLNSWAKRAADANAEEKEVIIKEVTSIISEAQKASTCVLKSYFEKHPQQDLDPNIEKQVSKDPNEEEQSSLQKQKSLKEQMSDVRDAQRQNSHQNDIASERENEDISDKEEAIA